MQELLETGLAEISDGLPVVKIDEKLGLTEPTYRTMPILRSDGTTLYSTKDLALTKRKFEEFGIDRAIWVVDVRQSLYFQQIFKILELWGFEQAKQAYHLAYEIVTLAGRRDLLPQGQRSALRRCPGQRCCSGRGRSSTRRTRSCAERRKDDGRLAGRHRLAQVRDAGARQQQGRDLRSGRGALVRRPRRAVHPVRARPRLPHSGECRLGSRRQRSAAAALGDLQLDFGAIQPEELALLQQIAALPEEVQRAAEEYRPLLIANYVYELAKAFNDFYHACPVLHSEEPVRTARLALVDATRQALANGSGCSESKPRPRCEQTSEVRGPEPRFVPGTLGLWTLELRRQLRCGLGTPFVLASSNIDSYRIRPESEAPRR